MLRIVHDRRAAAFLLFPLTTGLGLDLYNKALARCIPQDDVEVVFAIVDHRPPPAARWSRT